MPLLNCTRTEAEDEAHLQGSIQHYRSHHKSRTEVYLEDTYHSQGMPVQPTFKVGRSRVKRLNAAKQLRTYEHVGNGFITLKSSGTLSSFLLKHGKFYFGEKVVY